MTLILTIITIGCFISFILKPFLSFDNICDNIQDEVSEFKSTDLSEWKFKFQHPLSHKYDFKEKKLKDFNSSPQDQEEKYILNLTPD